MSAPPEPSPVTGWSRDGTDLEVWLVDLARDRDLLVARAHDFGTAPISGSSGDLAKVAAGIALRLVLARHVGAERARLPFVIAPGGKPALAGEGPQFSLAHCDGAALIAISRDGPVGVDIEAPRAIRISPDRRLMLEAEAQASIRPDHCPVGRQTGAFYRPGSGSRPSPRRPARGSDRCSDVSAMRQRRWRARRSTAGRL